MRFQFYCPRWGSEDIPWNDFLLRVKDEGYDGVEWAIAGDTPLSLIDDVANQISKAGLQLIPQHFDTNTADFQEHLDTYRKWFEKIKTLSVSRVNSQTGKDFFTADQNIKIIEVADHFSTTTGIAVYHETHRNKFSFAAHITKQYLDAIPNLKITLDASHWVNVAESYLNDQKDAMQLAIARTEHIHARIGFPEGPQVTDPRAPLWKEALETHLAWWDKVVVRKMNKGDDELLTTTSEFGPFPYLVVAPFTNQPIANQWDINVWMMRMLRDRYSALPLVKTEPFKLGANI